MTSSKIEREKRVNACLELRNAGARLSAIQDYAAKEGWGISTRQVKRYVQLADQLVLKEMTEDRQRLLAKHVSRREMIYARALKMGDLNLALKVLQDECRLLNVYPESAAANGHHADARMAILVAAVPRLQTALAALAPPVGSGDIAPLGRGDADDDIPERPGLVPVIADDRR